MYVFPNADYPDTTCDSVKTGKWRRQDDFIVWVDSCGAGGRPGRPPEYPGWKYRKTFDTVANAYAYDKNIRLTWELRSDLRNVFRDGHHPIPSPPPGTSRSLLEWAIAFGYTDSRGYLNNYGNWPYVGQKYIFKITDPNQLVHPASIPVEFGMSQNYPNPFNPSTTIRFGLPTAGNVSLIVYDVLGREVTTLVRGPLGSGYHTSTWNASSVASGVYFARLTVTNEFGRIAFNKVTKLLLMK
jgi:hypothetical protein